MGLKKYICLKKTYWGRHNELFTDGKTFHRIKSLLLTATASRHDQFITSRYFVPPCFDVHWNAPTLNWRKCLLYILMLLENRSHFNTVCDIVKAHTCHTLTSRWLDDGKEYIQSAWSKQRDYLLLGTRNHGCGAGLFERCLSRKLFSG